MISTWQSWLTMQPGRGGIGGRRGLVLVELLLILFVLVLAVVLLFMGLGRVRHQARLERLGAEMQAFTKVIEQARVENGRWPATAAEAGPRLVTFGTKILILLPHRCFAGSPHSCWSAMYFKE